MKVFISHKKDDSIVALKIQERLTQNRVNSYLDLLDDSITNDGRALTEHIRSKLNDCTDILVVMSNLTKYSQWVSFEVGMSVQNDMPTVTFLTQDVILPSFLSYWPRLHTISDIDAYVSLRDITARRSSIMYSQNQYEFKKSDEIAMFYRELKAKLNQ